MIRNLDNNDLNNWLKLAEEVEYLYGPMTESEEFVAALDNCIKEQNAYGVIHTNGELAGIIAIDRVNNEIAWLAVSIKYRGNNYGDMLVKKAIAELSIKGDIYVQTFADNIKEGTAARVIYLKNGFVDFKDSGRNPAGIDTVIMVKK